MVQAFLMTAAVFLGIPLLVSLILGGMIVLGLRLNRERRRGEADETAKSAGGDIKADANTRHHTGCLEAGEAPCVGVCPFGALSYDEKGGVVFTPESCPFGYGNGRLRLKMGPEGRVTVTPAVRRER